MKLRFILALLLLRVVCVAQTTSVTLQVTDTDSQTWNNGTWSATLTSNTSNGPFAILGTSTPVPNQSQSGALSASGGATMTLTPNSSIGPVGTQWAFHVCPQAVPAACYDFKATIQGASQNLTLTPPGIRISVVNPIIVVSAYQDLEITGQSTGSRYYNLTSLLSKEWNGSTWISVTPGGVPGGSPTQIQINNSGMFGAISNVAAGSVLASNGPSSLPIFQIKPTLDVRDTSGIDCTGTTDSSTALNAIFGSLTGRELTIPTTCVLRVDHQLVIQGQGNFVIRGRGNQPANVGPTIFGCNGTAGALLYINRSSYWTISGLNIQSQAAPFSACSSSFTQSMQIDNTGGGGFTPTEMTLEKDSFAATWTGTAAASYVGVNFTVNPNGENLRIRDSNFNCGNSSSSSAILVSAAAAFADDMEINHNRISNCFYGIWDAGGSSIRFIRNWAVNVGSNSVFGANGALVRLDGCSSPPVVIDQNELSNGGPFLNQGNDANGVGCKYATVSNNVIGSGDLATTNFILNIGNTSSSFNVVTGNQITSTCAACTLPAIGSVANSYGGVQRPIGYLYEVANSFSGTGSTGGISQNAPWSNGEFHASIDFRGSGPLGAVASIDRQTVDRILYPEFTYNSGNGGNRSAQLQFGSLFFGGGDTYYLFNSPNGDAATNTTFILSHPNTLVTGNLAVQPPFAGGIQVTAVPALVTTNDLVQNGGASGAATWTYQLVGVGGNSCITAHSGNLSNTTGPTTINSTNFNNLLIQVNDPGVIFYKIYRTVSGGTPSTTGFIGNALVANIDRQDNYIKFQDTGLAGDSTVPPTTSTCIGNLNAAGQLISSLATGTAPISVASTTPVANLTASNHPTLDDCGTTSTCSATQKTAALIVRGSVAFPTATTVTVTGLPFTGAANYSCTAGDVTTAAGVINATTYTSGSSVTFTETNGVNTDTIRYICAGF